MKRCIAGIIVLSTIVFSSEAFCQYENKITTETTKKLQTTQNVEITISILCIEGQKYIHEITYKGGRLSTNLVQQTYGNNQCSHQVDRSITVP